MYFLEFRFFADERPAAKLMHSGYGVEQIIAELGRR